MMAHQKQKARIPILVLAAVVAIGTFIPTGGLMKSYADSGLPQGTYKVEDARGGKFETLQEALEYASYGGTLKILDDIDLGEDYVRLSDDDFITLDLNGHTVTSSPTDTIGPTTRYGGTIKRTDSASLTITDTSEEKDGLLTVAGRNQNAIYSLDNSVVTVLDGTVSVSDEGCRAISSISAGTDTSAITVSGGTVSALGNASNAIIARGRVTVTISGGDCSVYR